MDPSGRNGEMASVLRNVRESGKRLGGTPIKLMAEC